MSLPGTFVSDVLTGKHDEDLDRLLALIKDRRHSLNNLVLFTLRVGDKVRLNNTTRPAYMRGMTGTVVKINGSSASVRLDQGMGRFSGVAPIRVPSSLLEKV